MPSDGVVKSIDVLADLRRSLAACLKRRSPDEFRFDCLEKRFHHGVIIAVPLAGHGSNSADVFERISILIRTILAAAI